jgi:hypothetical protein
MFIVSSYFLLLLLSSLQTKVFLMLTIIFGQQHLLKFEKGVSRAFLAMLRRIIG